MLAEAAAVSTDRSSILAALQRASAVTGSDFSYLLGTAMRESSLKPAAQSSTSSAAGLFQFIDQTWLGLIKNHGAKYGLGTYADAISRGADGRYRVDNSADRSAILALRKNPETAALMEGEHARETRDMLQSNLGRDVCGGELYAAHFLGPDAACRLIQLSQTQPNASAAGAFPQAASANKSVFYHSDGTPKTVRDVYNWALKQPSVGAGALAPETKTTPAVVPAPASDNGQAENIYDTFMSSFSHATRFFPSSDDSDATLPTTPFMLTPGIMDILSEMSPIASERRAS